MPLTTPIKIDYQRYSNILSLVSAIAIGESSPLFLEERVREFKDTVPFLATAVSWMGEAMDRLTDAKHQDLEHDPAALRNFWLHDEMLCRAQGTVTALLCVAEDIKAQLSQDSSAGPEPPSTT